MKEVKLIPEESSLLTALYILSSLVVVVWGIAEAQAFFIPVCIASILAVLMTPVVNILRRLHLPEWLAIIASMITLLAPILSLLYFLGYELQLFIGDLPRITHSLNQFLVHLTQTDLLSRFHLSVDQILPHLTQKALSSAGEGLQFILTSVTRLFEAGIQSFIIFIFTISMVATRKDLRRALEATFTFTSKQQRGHARIQKTTMVDEMIALIQQFLFTRFLIVLIVAGLDFIVLRSFGIKYEMILATFLGGLTLIPAVGFILGLIPTLIISISFHHSAESILGLLGCLIAVSAFESHFLTPKFLGSRLNLNLMATLFGVLAWSHLWGIWGLFLGIPILGIIRIILFQNPSLRRWGLLLADPKVTQRSLAAERRAQKAA